MPQVLIPQGDGTAIGDMTFNGGLAALFDSNNNQNTAASAGGAISGATVYGGKDWGASVTKTVSGFKIWGPNSDGISGAAADGDVTFTLQGSTDNFSASIVDLGNVSITDQVSATAEKLTGITTTTAYRYHRIRTVCANAPTGDRARLAEIEFYETTTSAPPPFHRPSRFYTRSF